MDSTEYGMKDLKLYQITTREGIIKVYAFNEEQAYKAAEEELKRRMYYCDT